MTGAPFGPSSGDLDGREAALLEALARVQARVASGESRDDALLGEPEDVRPDLEELLGVLDRVGSLAEPPSVRFAAALESRLLDAVDVARTEAGARRRPRWLSLPLMRFVAVIGAVVLALGAGGFAAVDAAEQTIPGDVLYPVKEASERVRLFFARGDGITRLRLAQLARRQAELEQAIGRGAPPRVVLRLEAKVAIATTELVQGARRFDATGNSAPAEATLDAVTELHDRVERLAGEESRPEVERLLRRMALYLEGQERAIAEITGDPRSEGAPPREAPSATPTTSGRDPAPAATATRAAPPTAPSTVSTPARGVDAGGAATRTAVPAPPSGSAVPSSAGGTRPATATPSAVRPR